ncbi:MAG: hypothetical protein BWX90_00353 [bacterium ADurb.Bin132]|nr:MAG: hypothetical protein BWX90_00353 [bacterium ADurb.Bin132]
MNLLNTLFLDHHHDTLQYLPCLCQNFGMQAIVLPLHQDKQILWKRNPIRQCGQKVFPDCYLRHTSSFFRLASCHLRGLLIPSASGQVSGKMDILGEKATSFHGQFQGRQVFVQLRRQDRHECFSSHQSTRFHASRANASPL